MLMNKEIELRESPSFFRLREREREGGRESEREGGTGTQDAGGSRREGIGQVYSGRYSCENEGMRHRGDEGTRGAAASAQRRKGRGKSQRNVWICTEAERRRLTHGPITVAQLKTRGQFRLVCMLIHAELP